MSVTRKETIGSTTTYDNGIIVANKSSVVNVDYTIQTIDGFDGKSATGIFNLSIAGVSSSEHYRFTFDYSGTGNPLDQAEPALQAYFTALDEKIAEVTQTSDTTIDDNAAEQPATGA